MSEHNTSPPRDDNDRRARSSKKRALHKPPVSITPPTDSDRETLRRIFDAGPDPDKQARKDKRKHAKKRGGREQTRC